MMLHLIRLFHLKSGATIVLLLISSALVSSAWLTLPFAQSSGGIALWHTGFAISLINSSAFIYPPHLAYPEGAPVVFGASLTYLQYIVMRLFSIDGINSYSVVGSIFAMIAVSGCYKLARMAGAGKFLSVALSLAFLSQTFFTIHIMGYGATGFGFALLPAFCAMFQAIITAPRAHGLRLIMQTIAIAVAILFFAFLDGYTFVMVLSCGVALLIGNLFYNDKKWRHYTIITIVFLSSTSLSIYLYKVYVPETAMPGYPINIFSLLSIHIPSMFWPTTGYSPLYDFLGVSAHRPAHLFAGAGLGNHETVFLSFSAIFAAILAASFRTAKAIRLTGLLMVCGGFLMAVGPVLPTQTGDAYTLEVTSLQREPLIKMPTYILYKSAPGLDQMRATYRWAAVLKLGLWILMCLACAHLASAGFLGKAAAFALVFVFMLEGSASMVRQWPLGRTQLQMAKDLTTDLTKDLQTYIPRNSKLIVLPMTNDFVVHAVAAQAEVFVYNVGGDKNGLIASHQRPNMISKIVNDRGCLAQNIKIAADQGLVDYVAFRSFDSHRGRRGWVWPPSPDEITENRRYSVNVLRDLPEQSLKKGSYFWFIDAHAIQVTEGKEQCENAK